MAFIRDRRRSGRGLVSTILNKGIDLLPIELHLPGGYRYCGPGTKLKERLTRGDPGINKLDEACKEHDIAYSKYSDNEHRRIADQTLADRAWTRVKSQDASLAERGAAWAVTTAMNAKTKLGSGQSKEHGRGLYLKPYKAKGLYLNPYKAKGLYLKPYKAKGLYLKPYKGKGTFIPVKPLTNIELHHFAKQLNIPNFRGVYMRDSLPSKPRSYESAIINLDSKTGEGTHWVCYRKRGNVVYYFDSFGDLQPPKELVEYMGPDVEINYNYNRNQSFNSVICGHLCLKFLIDDNVLS